MKCSNCPLQANVRCACSYIYLCHVHLGPHLLEKKTHSYETLDINLDNQRLIKLRSKILSEVHKINLLKNEITKQTKTLINFIELVLDQSLSQLDSFNNFYLSILKQKIFTKSDLETIKKIENFTLTVKKMDIEDVKSQIKFHYSQEFVRYEDHEADSRIQFLNKHNGGFSCGAVSGDGNMLVTGGLDSVVRVWSLVQKKQIFTLHGHNSEIQCLSLTADSQFIITGSNDASIRIWSINQKAQVGIFKGHNSGINTLCYFKNSNSVVSVDQEDVILIWNCRNFTITKKFTNLTDIYSLASTKDEFYLILGLELTIVILEIRSASVVKNFCDHFGPITSICLTANEKTMVSGSIDGCIIIWDVINSVSILKLEGNNESIKSVAITSNDQFIVSGSSDETVRIWSMGTGAQISQFNHTDTIYSILLVKNKVYSLLDDSSIGVFDIDSGSINFSWFLKHFNSNSISFLKDSRLAVYGCKSEVIIWDKKDQVEVFTFSGHQGEVQYAEISRDGKFVISCSFSDQNNLIYWNLQTGQKIAELIGHKDLVFCTCFSKDGLFAASGSADNTLRTWNLTKLKLDYKFKHDSHIRSTKFLDNERMLVSAGDDFNVIIWNLRYKDKYAVLSGHNEEVSKVLVTEDEKFVISACELEGVRVWNVKQKRQEYFFNYQDEAISWLNQNRIELDLLRKFLKA